MTNNCRNDPKQFAIFAFLALLCTSVGCGNNTGQAATAPDVTDNDFDAAPNCWPGQPCTNDPNNPCAFTKKCACSSLSIGQWCEDGKWVRIEDCYPACPLDVHSSKDIVPDDSSEISMDSVDTVVAEVKSTPDSADTAPEVKKSPPDTSDVQDVASVDSYEVSMNESDVPYDEVAAADTTAPADASSGGQVGEQCGGPGEGPCAKSLVCCYPCGIPGCHNKCAVPCTGGPCMNGCPMLP